MPSVTYMNQSAPFWDFVAGLEQQGQNHPFFSQNQDDSAERGEGPSDHHHPPPPPPFGPWGWGHGFGGRGFPHRGPPPPGPPPQDQHSDEKDADKEKRNDDDNGEGPSNSGSDTEGCARGRGRHGRCGSRRGRHGFGPHGGPHGRGGFGPHHGPHPHHHGHGRRGGWGGPWGRGGFFGGGGGFNPWSFANAFMNNNDENKQNDNDDFTPEADIFDTESSYIVHISLPGAKKEDVGVNWDAEKSELSIAGVIYRPGDEEFLKTLAMDERKVGPFERKIRLGTRANPAQVDSDMISAKLEDGVLRIDVPKLDTGYVEVRKVDIE